MTEVFFEFVRVGNSMKVTAIDVKTGKEAVIVGMPTLSRYSLEQAALRKLQHLLSKPEK